MIQPPKKKVSLNGATMTVYAIGWLAMLCNRSPRTVKEWEQKGYLPKPLLKASVTRRYYTVAEMLGYSEIYKRSNVRRHVFVTSTPFAADCLTLHTHLKQMLKTNPAVLGSKLKDETTMASEYKKRHAVKINQELARLSNGDTKSLA